MHTGLVAVIILLSVSANAGQPHQAPSSSSEDWNIDIRLDYRGRPLALALRELTATTPRDTEIAGQISEVLRNDLRFASVFSMLSPAAFPSTAAQRGNFPYVDWQSSGADVVVTGEVTSRNANTVVTVKVFAIRAQTVAFGTEYLSQTPNARHLAHRIADDILAQTGLVGVARTRIAYSSDRGRNERRSLFVMDYDGHQSEPLTSGRYLDLEPDWAPIRSAVSFITYPTAQKGPWLGVLESDKIHHLYQGPGMVFSAAWSPDGSKIAFSASVGGNAEIYVASWNGHDHRPLTDHPETDVSPTWSPTGREIAFTSSRTGSPQIWVMDVDGLNLRRLTHEGAHNTGPDWSPSLDYAEIAYVSRSSGHFDVFVHDLQLGKRRRLTKAAGLNESPSWSPNGRHLVFSSTRTGTSQIFTMERDGSNVRQLTFEGTNATPSWGPVPPR